MAQCLDPSRTWNHLSCEPLTHCMYDYDRGDRKWQLNTWCFHSSFFPGNCSILVWGFMQINANQSGPRGLSQVFQIWSLHTAAHMKGVLMLTSGQCLADVGAWTISSKIFAGIIFPNVCQPFWLWLNQWSMSYLCNVQLWQLWEISLPPLQGEGPPSPCPGLRYQTWVA